MSRIDVKTAHFPMGETTYFGIDTRYNEQQKWQV